MCSEFFLQFVSVSEIMIHYEQVAVIVISNCYKQLLIVNVLSYCRPLSMSENLTKLAHKIDFSKDESEEKGKPTSEGDKEEDDSAAPIQPALWPWDSVWNKLKYVHYD